MDDQNPASARPWPRTVLRVVIPMILGAIVAVTATRLMSPAKSSAGPEPRSARIESGPAAAPARSRTASRANLSNRDKDALIEARMAEVQERQLAQYRSFQGQFARERPDPAWAAAKETRMLEASTYKLIGEANALPANFKADCRASTCRIDADFPNRGVGEDFLVLFANAMGNDMPNMSFMYSTNPDGTTHVEAYALGRK